MNQSKYPLALVINVLTAIAIGYVCFLGLNFYTLGDKMRSIIFSVVIIIFLIATSVGARQLKKTKRNCKRCRVMEWMLLILFTLIVVGITYFPFSHYFGVTINKEEIQSKVLSNISHFEQLYDDYEKYVKQRDSNYLRKLENAVNYRLGDRSDFNCFGFDEQSGVSLQTQISTKHSVLKLILIPANFKSLKSSDSVWLKDAQKSVENWEPISLVDVINNIQTNTSTSLNNLINISQKRAACEDDLSFIFPNPSFPDVKNQFTTIGKPSPLSILISILGYVLMLLYWFITKRDSRCIGALKTAEYEVVL
ncbi:hypothetical protein [Flavobacterium sp.]|uniref:hypothetical protein n=1 Tax=Flavobacterium sp. TaxID=239 RepID=UPI002FDA6E65